MNLGSFAIVYALGGALVLVAGLYYAASYAQRRQQLSPAGPAESPLQFAARVYLAGVYGRIIGAIIIGIAIAAYIFWPR